MFGLWRRSDACPRSASLERADSVKDLSQSLLACLPVGKRCCSRANQPASPNQSRQSGLGADSSRPFSSSLQQRAATHPRLHRVQLEVPCSATASIADMSTHHRPRLSPKCPGELNARPDYFVTATPPPHAPSPAASASAATPTSSSGAQQKQPTFSSPSSHAFNADFDSLMRPPPPSSLGAGTGQQQPPPPQTPLHAPASSPFFPSAGPGTSIRGETAKGAPSTATNAPHVMQQQQQPPSNPSSPQSASTFKIPTVPFTRRTSGATTGGAVPVKSNRYSLFSPQRLAESILSSASGSDILILDIRTRTAFSSERLAGSINVCVPSTLLRRPAFGVDRVRDSLPPQDQDRFDSWRASEPCRAIVVIDQESVALVEGAGPASLLAKFDNAGYQGELGWVKGGWNAVRNGLVAMGPSLQEQERLLEHGEREEFVFDDEDGDDEAQHAENDGGPPPQPRASRSLSSSSGFPSNTTTPHSPGLTGLPGSKKHARGGGRPPSTPPPFFFFSRL